jgi:hypothetical protein
VLNDAFLALQSNFLGTADPTGAAAADGAWAVRTDTAELKIRIAGAYVVAGKYALNLGHLRIDGTNAMTGSLDMDGQDIILTADGNTRIENGTNNSIRLVINTVETIVLGQAAGEFAFNETGLDINTRFESDTNANLLFLDAGLDSGAGMVGVRTATPVSVLDVFGSFSHQVIATSSTPYNLTAADSYLEVTTGAGLFTVNLPAIVRGRRYHVKMVVNGGGNIAVVANGANTIEDEGTSAAGTTVTLSGVNSSVTLYGGTGTVWRIEDFKGTMTVA